MTALRELARQLNGRRVLVVGDVMLDHFLVGRVDRISPEAPVPVVRFDRDEFRLGGAANVAQNIASLGGDPVTVGVIGTDEAASALRAQFAAAGIGTGGLVADASRPTTKKMRVVTSRNQQVARIDHEVDSEISGDTLRAVTSAVSAVQNLQAIVLSDYRKGVITADIIRCTIELARARKIPLLVDPKVPHPDRYKGATLITPNHHEAELMTGTRIRTPEDARTAARLMHERTGADVLITWGEHGMWVLDGSSKAPVERALPAMAREVSDVTGAGDTVIAVLALGLAAGASLVDAAELANTAAGIVVARFGPASVTPADLAAALAVTQT